MGKISEEKKQLMQSLYAKGWSIKEIAKMSDVSYSAVYSYTRIRQMLNPETGQPFKSNAEYENYNIKHRTNPETGKPFQSKTEYKNYNAKHRTNPETGKPFQSKTEYENYNAKHRPNPETGKPFKSLFEYQYFLHSRAQHKAKNQGLSDLIEMRLKELRRNQGWLARQIGMTRSSVSLYAQGKVIPRNDILKKLFSALKVQYQTLDDLL